MSKGRFFSAAFVMVLLLSACGAPLVTTEPSVPPSSAPVAASEKAAPETPQTNSSSESVSAPASEISQGKTQISLDFGGITVLAEMEDSDTATAFLERLPLTISMNRYADREYYAAISSLPENGEAIPDFENGDITYYATGKSLAIFFGNAGNSHQSGLIRIGKITSDLTVFDSIGDRVEVTIQLAGEEGENKVQKYDFSIFSNVEITGATLNDFDEEQLLVLYQQARYCQAMTDMDTDTMREIVSEDMIFTHMSGRQQIREEYLADVKSGSLRYFTIGIENPVVEVDGDLASVYFTSVLNANAYGAQGTYRMTGRHWYQKQNGAWIAVNAPNR